MSIRKFAIVILGLFILTGISLFSGFNRIPLWEAARNDAPPQHQQSQQFVKPIQ